LAFFEYLPNIIQALELFGLDSDDSPTDRGWTFSYLVIFKIKSSSLDVNINKELSEYNKLIEVHGLYAKFPGIAEKVRKYLKSKLLIEARVYQVSVEVVGGVEGAGYYPCVEVFLDLQVCCLTENVPQSLKVL
jgi:hypothetical protein